MVPCLASRVSSTLSRGNHAQDGSIKRKAGENVLAQGSKRPNSESDPAVICLSEKRRTLQTGDPSSSSTVVQEADGIAVTLTWMYRRRV